MKRSTGIVAGVAAVVLAGTAAFAAMGSMGGVKSGAACRVPGHGAMRATMPMQAAWKMMRQARAMMRTAMLRQMAMRMRTMRQQRQQLAGLVAAMDRTTGQGKIDAMAAVVRQLAIQRETDLHWREHMMRTMMHHGMMDHMMRGGMMGGGMMMCPMMRRGMMGSGKMGGGQMHGMMGQ